MKCLLLFCLFVCAGRCLGGVIIKDNCPYGMVRHKSSCIIPEDLKEKPDISTKERVIKSAGVDAECLPKSQWQSNCHDCECSENGVAKCVKQKDCAHNLEPIRCKPNTTFYRECNTCVCLENGLGLCTLVGCQRPSQHRVYRDVTKKSELPSGKRCSPGSMWASQCNSCHCTEKGNPICTLMECSENADEPIKECAPNTVWKNECNTCSCTSSGSAMCTRMECPITSLPQKSELPSGHDCSPGSTWESQCNSCHCTEDGFAMCTLMGCPESEDEPIKECAPNTVWKDECNTCSCTSSGIATCTRMECATVTLPQKSELLSGKKCSPGSTWKSQCNSCHCTEDGFAMCTLMECPENADEPIKECAPNTVWKNECNTCSCTSSGSAMCTRMECPITSIPQKLELPSGKSCSPGSTWKSQCNTCNCNKDGLPECTKQECPENKNEPIMECAPNTTWKNECNTCRCTSSGNVMCTRMECPITSLPQKLELPSGKRCSPGSTWKSQCNTCNCNEDGLPECTKQECPEYKNEPIKDCAPNTVWKNECNTCWCTSSGIATCTRMECYSHLEHDIETKSEDSSISKPNSTLPRKTRAVQELPKACQPGQEFRLDCNKCLCDNEGQHFSCTRIDCSAVNNNHNSDAFSNPRTKREVTKQEKTNCVPGSVFDHGCNVCRCTDEGHHATCTLKRCHQKHDVDIQPTDQDPGFRCNAGEQFTRDCNDCTCSADGKSIFCTLRLCDQDLTPDI